jgi:hypothetical protein
MDLTTATPAEIDTRLAELEAEDAQLTRQIRSAMLDLRQSLGQQQERITLRNGKTEWVWLISAYDTEREAVALREAGQSRTTTEAAYDQLHALRQHVLVNRAERTKISAEFDRRGGWTRAWAVVGGHIHSSRSCHTCFPTTRFQWLPQVSGMDEAEIVELAGERACTVCYPSAPVDALKRACQLWTAQETADAEAMAARARELAAKRDAKAAKSIANPDGTPLRDDYNYPIKTETTAEQLAVRLLHDHLAYGYSYEQKHADLVTRIALALAHKRGTGFDTEMANIATKAGKKAAKTKREMERMSR